MPTSLRTLAMLHCVVLALMLVLPLTPVRLSWFALLLLVTLTPLGPLLFIDRPLMWRLAKFAAYGFAFACGVWLMYGVFGISGLGDVPRLLGYLLLAFYFIGVGGYLKSDPIRAHFRVAGAVPAA
ncbi:MAG: hypothetical protein AAGA68_25440 [Pseudomonadota bacterium]